jgi:hypothetical protein
MISLGVTNSRMKDFYDVHVLASCFAFEGTSLAQAIRATLVCRGTPFPDAVPLALSEGFLAAPERQLQWRAFLRRSRLAAPLDANALAAEIRRFLAPVLAAAARNEPPPGVRVVAAWGDAPRGPCLAAGQVGRGVLRP